MRVSRLWWGVFMPGALLVACSVLSDTSDLQGGSPDTVNATDATSGQDAPKDGGTADGATADDGSTIDSGVSDAGDNGDASVELSGPFCASKDASYCNDFDTVAFAYGAAAVAVSGSIGSNDAAAVSPPLSLFTNVPSKDAGGATYSYLFWKTSGSTVANTTIRASFQIRLDLMTTSGGSLFLISNPKTDAKADLFSKSVSGASSTSTFVDYFSTDAGLDKVERGLKQVLKLSTWTRVDILISTGAPAMAQVKFDDVSVLDPTPLTGKWPPGSEVEVKIGTGYTDNTNGRSVYRYDDVLIDVK